MAELDAGEIELGDVAETVKRLVELMHEHGLTKIDVSVGSVSIKLRAGGAHRVATSRASEPVEVDTVAPVRETEESVAPPAGHVITSPMIGTFYSSAAPGEPPFVHLGDRVEPGQTIGIIEAMKIMNEIVADRGGTVTEILVTNAQPVEYGSPLIRFAADETGG